MPVSKRHLLYSFVILICIYIVLQIRLHLDVITVKLSPKSDAESKQNAANTAVEAFMKVCHSHGFPAFIIDRRILLSLTSNETARLPCSQHCHEWCKYLCTDRSVTPFGIISYLWRLTEKTSKAFNQNGFSVLTYSYPAEFLSVQSSSHGDDMLVPVRVLFSHDRGHVIHLVLFYQRGDDQYLWHGGMTTDQSTQLGIISNESFIQHEGAFSRFDLVKVQLDNVRVRVPKDPLAFLLQITSSKFTGCDRRRAESFHAEYGKRETNVDAEMFYKSARDILVTVKQVLDSMGVRFWLSSGTCLGWFRQCDLIPYSKDVDIGIWITDYKGDIIQRLQDSGLVLAQQFGKVEDSFELSFVGENVKLDIFFFYEETDFMWNGGTQARTGKKFKYIFPKFSLCWTEFLRLKVRVPCNTSSYIEANYGPNWFKPVKTWDWKKSPPNVQPNGEWSPEERSAVIQQLNIN